MAITVTGASASVLVAASPGTPSTSFSGVRVDGASAIVYINQGTGGGAYTGTPTPGDFFAAPIELTGAGGTVHPNLSTSTVESGEPVDGIHTVWLRHVGTEVGMLVLTSNETAYSHMLELYSGTGLADLNLLESAAYEVGVSTTNAVVSDNTSPGSVLYVRVRDLLGTADSDVSVDWAFTAGATTGDGVLAVQMIHDEVIETPGVITLAVLNALPNEDIQIKLGTAVLATAPADPNGAIYLQSVPIPELADPGTYTLTLESTSGRIGRGTFTVRFAPPTNPTLPGGHLAPQVVIQSTPVVRWVFQDLLTGGLGSYVVPINPSTMSSPFRPKVLQPERTTSPQGQHIIWGGGKRAYNWSFSGTIIEQAHYDNLLAYSELNRRIYIIDNRNRAWISTIEEFNAIPKRIKDKPWAHTYTMTCLIWGGPFTP